MRLIFAGPDSGTELVRTVSGSTAPSTVEVSFEPLTTSDQLVGEPTGWCNTPGAGQALVFDVPAPANPGDPDTLGTLKISKAGSNDVPTRIPIRIVHST